MGFKTIGVLMYNVVYLLDILLFIATEMMVDFLFKACVVHIVISVQCFLQHWREVNFCVSVKETEICCVLTNR